MDNKRIVEILKGTIDSQYRQEAEEQLNQVYSHTILTLLSSLVGDRTCM